MKYNAHVYAILFADSSVKVGYTARPVQRIQAHKGDGRRFGIDVVDVWMSPPHYCKLASKNESRLIRFCESHDGSVRQSREKFAGVQFDDVVEFAKRLPFHQLTPSELQIVEADIQRRSETLFSKVRRSATPVGTGTVSGDYVGALSIARTCQAQIWLSGIGADIFTPVESCGGRTDFEMFASVYLANKDADARAEYASEVFDACSADINDDAAIFGTLFALHDRAKQFRRQQIGAPA